MPCAGHVFSEMGEWGSYCREELERSLSEVGPLRSKQHPSLRLSVPLEFLCSTFIHPARLVHLGLGINHVGSGSRESFLQATAASTTKRTLVQA